jgi:2-C-methyl-D-erythritol 4-phosphate cytidylyltransferase / 2-C-methyl-D-erythritol 2,4-cyclodiphosphate synthase
MPRPHAAVLVAAGRSTRMGADKLWIDLYGRPVWRWSLDVLLGNDAIGGVALVVPSDSIDRFATALSSDVRDRCLLVAGGDDRAASVLGGLEALAAYGWDDSTLVLVHDAARPALSPQLVARIISAAEESPSGAVIPVVAVTDSLKEIQSDEIVGRVERAEVVAAQTPQAARLGVLRDALVAARSRKRAVTDEASALETAGHAVRSVEGDPANRKLTIADDLPALRATLAARSGPPDTGPVEAGTERVASGFDAHRLVAGREMRLGGLHFADEPAGPMGHSDGDAVLHAVTDAILGAAGLGDIGTLFPSNDAGLAGADSRDLLRRAVSRLTEAGWSVRWADVTIAARRPAIAPRREEMVAAIADALGVPADAVSVKASTSDGLGFAGAEGIAAWAVAGVRRG